MNHDEVLEQLELAAVEPGGLDRLIAGDTPAAAALAGHLAACPECTREFDELRRSTMIIRAVIATQPPPELRERTLQFVATVGRARGAPAAVPALAGAAAGAGASASVATPASDAASPPPSDDPAATPAVVATAIEDPSEPISLADRRTASVQRRASRPWTWLAATAALILLAVGLTAAVASNLSTASSRKASFEIAGLAEVASWTARLESTPDVQHVVLTSVDPATSNDLVGSLIFSPSTREVVVIADGLSEPDRTHEYGCWVQIGGTRERIGKMFLSDDLGYWVGDSPVLASVPAGSEFGVSLVDTAGSGGNQAVMSGTLQGS